MWGFNLVRGITWTFGRRIGNPPLHLPVEGQLRRLRSSQSFGSKAVIRTLRGQGPLRAYSVEKLEVFLAPRDRVNGSRLYFTWRLWPGLGLGLVWPIF